MGDGRRGMKRLLLFVAGILLFVPQAAVWAGELHLQGLIAEALQASPEIQAARAKASASGFRVPQSMSLPDPMVMVGYQNEGTSRLTYNESPDSQYLFSASQLFFFPGKRALKGEAASREAESLSSSAAAVQLRIIAVIKEFYYDLFLAHQSLDLIREKAVLLRKLEDAALARYAAGGGMQQDVLMAQAEKYMLLERETMLQQKIQTLEAQLNAMVGRDQTAPLDRPAPPVFVPYPLALPDLIAVAYENSPEVRAREKMVASTNARVRVAEREYYPDIAVTGNYGLKGPAFENQDMWSLTTTLNIPLYYTTKQQPAVQEAEASQREAKNELQGVRLRLSAAIRENYAMLQSTERLMELYRQGLTLKIHQDFQSALATYATGKTDALSVISRLKAITEIETSYWGQLVEREKARARLEALTGKTDSRTEEGRQ
ncbi:MAG: TolC family protein [Desulfobulbaceae bacterium]|nr:TolC family protein [Desulfobulbaceae bacterium]HIJ90480.1 TolC family protein [Deltaproteobacteria bacterium]